MTKMKKILAIGLAGVLAVGFAACSNGASEPANDNKEETATAKTGFAVTASLGHISHDESEETIEISTVAAAVLVDADGKVITCQIDEAQTQPNLKENDGFVAEDALRTKKQKLEDYGMKSASPIQKEWYEQVDAFEKWTVGKTADQVTAGIGEDGYPTDADLKAGCTIWAGNFAKVVSEAITNAADKGAAATDTLKLVMQTEKYYESKAGELVQYDTNIAAVTTDADGKITSCIVDATQGKCYVKDGKFVDKDGKAYPEMEIKSKKQLQGDYAMKSVSPIQKEWFEQAEAYEAWAVGKTADEIKAGMGEDGKVADLASSCTITAYGFTSTVAEAATK